MSSYFPAAAIGKGNYVYAYSGGPTGADSKNYWGISAVTSICSGGLYMASTPAITVKQAYDIDKKVDDGLPQSGSVMAFYDNVGFFWAGPSNPPYQFAPPYTSATPGTTASCFDNGNVTGAQQQYSVEISNGANVNCALSFQFQ
jgi:hypothetical protein